MAGYVFIYGLGQHIDRTFKGQKNAEQILYFLPNYFHYIKKTKIIDTLNFQIGIYGIGWKEWGPYFSFENNHFNSLNFKRDIWKLRV